MARLGGVKGKRVNLFGVPYLRHPHTVSAVHVEATIITENCCSCQTGAVQREATKCKATETFGTLGRGPAFTGHKVLNRIQSGCLLVSSKGGGLWPALAPATRVFLLRYPNLEAHVVFLVNYFFQCPLEGAGFSVCMWLCMSDFGLKQKRFAECWPFDLCPSLCFVWEGESSKLTWNPKGDHL